MQKVIYQDWGQLPYKEAWDRQTELHEGLKLRKKNKEGVGRLPSGYFIVCSHDPVYTLGKSGSIDHLKLDEQGLSDHGLSFYKINRGGDITYHGPGQVVGYPIIDLELFFTDVHRYVRSLEEMVILTLEEYGIEGLRYPKYTGVWLEPEGDKPWRKICAIGVHLSRWVSMHGFAFNVNTHLPNFNHIIPCGIQEEDKTVTSLQKELGTSVDQSEVKEKLSKHFAQLFECEMIYKVEHI